MRVDGIPANVRTLSETARASSILWVTSNTEVLVSRHRPISVSLKPDLVIYLQADTDLLIKNIAKRGRRMEKNITWEYIDALNQVYTEYFFRYQETPLVIINTNNIDFVNNENDLKEVINYIRQPVSGTKFFNPVTDY